MQLPLTRFGTKEVVIKLQSLLFSQLADNFVVLLLRRLSIINRAAEAINQRKFFLYGIIGMQFFITVTLIFKSFTNQMTAV